jgi:hypothetical protein
VTYGSRSNITASSGWHDAATDDAASSFPEPRAAATAAVTAAAFSASRGMPAWVCSFGAAAHGSTGSAVERVSVVAASVGRLPVVADFVNIYSAARECD